MFLKVAESPIRTTPPPLHDGSHVSTPFLSRYQLDEKVSYNPIRRVLLPFCSYSGKLFFLPDVFKN